MTSGYGADDTRPRVWQTGGMGDRRNEAGAGHQACKTRAD